jgi:hypothetical protein
MGEYQESVWALPKENQKRSLEAEICEFLEQHSNLSDIEEYFLSETLGYLHAGRYELAYDSMDDAWEPPAVDRSGNEISEAAKSITRPTDARTPIHRRYLGARLSGLPLERR